jgi:tetratricopeptide (TPR) repeat protein
MKKSIFAAAVLLAWAIGCGGGGTEGPGVKTPAKPTGPTDSKGNEVSTAAQNKFNSALDAMATHDKANDWSDATCASTAQMFVDAAKEQGDKTFGEAIYDAGLSYQRCKNDKEAKGYFKQVLDKDPKFHRARAQLALYAFAESGEKDFDPAINELRQAAITDAQFKNVEALVNLGMIYIKRNNQSADTDGANDLARAKKYIQSALAVDDGYMPAFNQLAILYLEAAKQKAGRDAKASKTATAASKQAKVDTQALELAALVCSQAVRKNAKYAPIHNTAGMIQVELSNLNSAVGEFNNARTLDPSFYEAQMNYAAVNLRFRGFAQAEEAYRAALKMRPNDYDAHLGLALALRGQIDDSNFDKKVAEAAAEIDAAKKAAPDRAETYYNEAILTQEYKAKSGGKSSEAELLNAKGLFGQFVQKAGAAPEFADAVKRSKDRMTEIDQIIEFAKQSEKDRKAAEADLKQKQAEAEAKEGSEGDAADKDKDKAPDPGADKKDAPAPPPAPKP